MLWFAFFRSSTTTTIEWQCASVCQAEDKTPFIIAEFVSVRERSRKKKNSLMFNWLLPRWSGHLSYPRKTTKTLIVSFADNHHKTQEHNNRNGYYFFYHHYYNCRGQNKYQTKHVDPGTNKSTPKKFGERRFERDELVLTVALEDWALTIEVQATRRRNCATSRSRKEKAMIGFPLKQALLPPPPPHARSHKQTNKQTSNGLTVFQLTSLECSLSLFPVTHIVVSLSWWRISGSFSYSISTGAQLCDSRQ